MDAAFYRRAFLAPGADDLDEQLVNARHPANVQRLRRLVDAYCRLRRRGLAVEPSQWPLELLVHPTPGCTLSMSVMGRDRVFVCRLDPSSGLTTDECRYIAFDADAMVAEVYRVRGAATTNQCWRLRRPTSDHPSVSVTFATPS